ncbi:MAG: hypothetical protein Q8L48_05455 [Archangium sp.]|nr:hypothetical protein [Archangium sp.]
MTRLVGVLALLASAAWADIPPADTSGCGGKTAGETCKKDDGSEGSCVKATCSRNDYSNGPPPTSVQYECLKCGAAVAAPAPEKKNSCAAVPAESVLALLLVVLSRRRSR